jgi:serine/threonine-protein kinase
VTPERWREVARIYEAVADLDPVARDGRLWEACAGDDLLRREVEALLRQDEAAVVLDAPVWLTAAPLFDDGPLTGPGSLLGNYRIVEGPVGAGGMGTVFRGTDTRLDRQVAIKVLPTGVGRDPQARARFAREARAVAALTHPHICTLYDVGRHGEIDYLVMEYLEGETLAARLTRGPLPVAVALTHANEIAGALAHAHRLGIVHRDLKPANIMLTAGGATLLDFGVAKWGASPAGGGVLRDSTDAAAVQRRPAPDVFPPADGRGTGVTRDGSILGTVRYMAPEQIVGRGVDARSDIFSFGVVLYEMLTGQPAFGQDGALSIRAAILEGDPPPVSSLQPQVPPELDAVVRRCLAKSPERRWQTAADLARALQQVSDSIGTSSGAAAGVGASRRAKWGAATALAVVLVAVAGSALWIKSLPTSPPTEAAPADARIRSVAVLPLASVSMEHEYFADAMTEQLIADLARIAGLRVIARTSTWHYKTASKPIPTVARELQVDAIIEGSVIHAGDRVQITARLIRGTSGDVIWAQTFERELRDVLALQREIARAITSKVDVTLTGPAQAGQAPVRPVDPEIHRQVLLGRYQLAKATEAGLQKAIQYFEGVISRDAENALAHAGLAEAYMELSGFYMHPRQAMPRAKRAALAALALDDSLADAHAALGYIHLVYDWDGPSAEKELLRALDLNPTLAMARLNYAAYLASQNRPDATVQEIRRAVHLDPLSIRTYSFGTLFLLFARRYDDAIALARKGLELEPRSAFTMAFEGAGYAALGRHDEAVGKLASAVRLDNSLTIRALHAHVLAVAGRHDEARAVLGQLEQAAKTRYFCPYEIATVYVSLGEQDTATDWFRKGIEDRADCMPWLGVEPWMDPYRADPRYISMLKEIGLTPIGATGH